MMAKLRSMITHANQKIENINKRIEFVLILIISLGGCSGDHPGTFHHDKRFSSGG